MSGSVIVINVINEQLLSIIMYMVGVATVFGLRKGHLSGLW